MPPIISPLHLLKQFQFCVRRVRESNSYYIQSTAYASSFRSVIQFFACHRRIGWNTRLVFVTGVTKNAALFLATLFSTGRLPITPTTFTEVATTGADKGIQTLAVRLEI